MIYVNTEIHSSCLLKELPRAARIRTVRAPGAEGGDFPSFSTEYLILPRPKARISLDRRKRVDLYSRAPCARSYPIIHCKSF